MRTVAGRASHGIPGGIVMLFVAVLGPSLAGVRGPMPWCVAAQEEPEQEPLITLTSVSPKLEKGKWVVKVSGRAPKLPRGTKVDFHVTWQSQIVQTFEVVIQESSFSQELKMKKVPLFSGELMLRTVIELKKQSARVKNDMEKDPKTFNPVLQPWTDYHFKHTFRIGTEEDREKEMQEVSAFFTDRIDKLLAIDKAVRQRIKEAKADVASEKAGEFDKPKYGKWLEKEALKPLREVQAEIKERIEKDTRFLPHRLTLMRLLEVTNGVAKRVVKKTVDLYKETGVAIEAQDKKPKDLDLRTRVRGTPKGRHLNREVQEIRKALGLDGQAGKEEEKS